MPGAFVAHARTSGGGIAAMSAHHVYGVQFHPEVTHTMHGKTILANFVLKIAGCTPDWQPSSMIASIQSKVMARLGTGKAIFGFSGGVDSTAVAAILSPALGSRLLAVTIDGGNLREGELDEIKRHAAYAKVELRIIDARAACEAVMADTIDAEEKRRRFKKVYVSVLVKAAEDFGATAVLQGTLAPDRIESGATGGAVIKSHHNVGLDMGDLIQLHPVDELFKYEIRALAKEIGLPESVWNRQPFPGPGLFLRTVGIPATQENVAITRWADARVRDILVQHDVYDKLSQVVVAYVGVNTVAVKGDARAYTPVVVVRAVQTTDFMTAKGVHFSEAIQDAIQTVVTKHPKVGRVWFDPTDKPPATTELE